MKWLKVMKKKIAAVTLAVLFMMTLLPTQTFAATKYCSVAGCNKTTTHSHSGKQYYGHSKNDGHAYHKCGLSKCTQKSSHTHKKTSSSKHSGKHH